MGSMIFGLINMIVSLITVYLQYCYVICMMWFIGDFIEGPPFREKNTTLLYGGSSQLVDMI